ncbi:N-acylglucosamine 2-epimerase [Chitinimonas arctica]|uniref:N-acylglucosamine 2-epimerase n=1 Tax=Chitinimonas arctica TaxID=2594795 RepID=A0A516SC41_9NEIS|nr:N-acylglucosamine 2-epimerase [Chitinimonas arctica]QDQ25711.1 N-acylglucosamine 2-epimerase [Chitinimonas arctica]
MSDLSSRLIIALLVGASLTCLADEATVQPTAPIAVPVDLAPPAAPESPDVAVEPPPPGQRWLQHARNDLLPWWTQAAAQGEPVGRFPTFRCNDGSAYLAAKPCPELANPPAWLKGELGRDYVRMQARQIYAYAMGFHLTGDIKLLRLAQAGVADLRERALDRKTGSAASWYEKGKPMPAIGLRTAQDLSYAGLGLASMYYLTRDPLVLVDLIKLKQHIFASYRDAKTGLIRWQAKGGSEAQREELVATLDQLNAYMVLVAPILPEGPLKQQWLQDIATLSKAMVSRFHDAEQSRFWGTRGQADSESADGRHNDFGHTVKAYWMLYLGARLNRDQSLSAFARDGMRKTLDRAWLKDSGSWGEKLLPDGRTDPNKSWWSYAELDQAAATLAMLEGDKADRWKAAGDWWLTHFVDSARGEVWGSLPADGKADTTQLKQHHWKNGFHSMEHALVNYIASQALADQPATLYFALPNSKLARNLTAYMFGGREISRQNLKSDAGVVQRVEFSLKTEK